MNEWMYEKLYNARKGMEKKRKSEQNGIKQQKEKKRGTKMERKRKRLREIDTCKCVCICVCDIQDKNQLVDAKKKTIRTFAKIFKCFH